MTTITRSALHVIANQGGKLVCEDDSLFDVEAYSRLKYGNVIIAREYGVDLAELFIKQFPELARSNSRVIVTTPSYKYLAIAAQSIAATFVSVFNTYRVINGFEPSILMHIVRSSVGSDTYAMSDAASRQKALAGTGHSFDRTLVEGSVVVFIDDVRISGATEERMHERLMQCAPEAVCYLHVARLDENQGQAMPKLEDTMNKAFQPTLATIEADIVRNEFQLNSRVFDFMMKCPNGNEFYEFLGRRSDAFIEAAYTALVNGTVEFYARYPEGTGVLERVVRERQLPAAAFMIPLPQETPAEDPMSHLSEAERITVLDYDRNAPKRQRGPEFWLPEVDVVAEILGGRGRILEIGCGNGAEGESLTNRGFSYVGTDISRGYMNEARVLRPHLDTRHMSAYHLLFPDNSFDGLWSGNTLYHLPKEKLPLVLDEINRVVRPDGLIFISLPIGESEGLWTKKSFGYESTRLWSRYIEDEATALFAEHGLEQERIGHKESNGSGQADEVIQWTLYFLRNTK